MFDELEEIAARNEAQSGTRLRVVGAMDPWRMIGAAELSLPLPPIPWVCEALGMAPGAVSMVAGYGYSGKTMALQSLGLSVVLGTPVWGVYRCKQGRVVHLDYEQGRRLTQEKYQRLARGMGADIGDAKELRVGVMPRRYLDERSSMTELVRVVDGASLVLIDSLKGSLPGADENSSNVRQHLDMLSRVSEQTHATMVFIHHARKPQEGDANGVTFSIRGSSALFDACQSVWVFRGGKDEPTTVHHQKDRIRGATVDDFQLTREDVMGPDGNPRWGLRVRHVELTPAEDGESKLRKTKEAILRVLRTRPEGLSVRELRELVGGRFSMTQACLEGLLRSNTITVIEVPPSGTGRPYKVVRLTSGTNWEPR